MCMERPSDRTRRGVAHALDGRSGSVTLARDHARAFLDGRSPRLPDTAAQDVLLVVTELVTNAVRHAPGPCTLTMADDGRELTVAVSDTSAELPVPRPPDLATGGGGFGMYLLARLALRTYASAGPQGGKTVTAVLAAP